MQARETYPPLKGWKESTLFPPLSNDVRALLTAFLNIVFIVFSDTEVFYVHCRTLGKYRKAWRKLKLPTVLPRNGNPTYHIGTFPSWHTDVNLSRVKRVYTNLASCHMGILCLLYLLLYFPISVLFFINMLLIAAYTTFILLFLFRLSKSKRCSL